MAPLAEDNDRRPSDDHSEKPAEEGLAAATPLEGHEWVFEERNDPLETEGLPSPSTVPAEVGNSLRDSVEEIDPPTPAVTMDHSLTNPPAPPPPTTTYLVTRWMIRLIFVGILAFVYALLFAG